jgi:hypothetical protein
MDSRHPEIGVCGLSCRLCPRFHAEGPSRCAGCKGESRMAAGCPFISCAVKRRGIEFCWDCDESDTCERWARHRAAGQEHDSFVSYAALDCNIASVERLGIEAFIEDQLERERLLIEMLVAFNEGRSKSYYCVAATVLRLDELRAAILEARALAAESDVRARAKALHEALDTAARARSLTLALRR